MYKTKRSFALACLMALTLYVNALPQQKTTPVAEAKTVSHSKVRKSARPATASPKPPCKQGDFTEHVDPTATGSFTIPICLAQHSPVVIEFPANDPFYAHLPGDENFVTVDKRSKTTDPLVIRPGDGFYVEAGRVRPSSVISVQMTSGLVGSFAIYAIEDVSNNNNHVIVTYNRDEVILARRRLGLRADLVPADQLAPYLDTAAATSAPAAPIPQPTPAVSAPPRFLPRTSSVPVQVQTSQPSLRSLPAQTFSAANLKVSASLPPADTARHAPSSLPSNPIVVSTAPASLVNNPPTVSSVPNNVVSESSTDLESMTRGELSRVSAAKTALRFGQPLHGLALAVGRSRFLIAGYRIEVVAVRNTLKDPIRLVPGQPEIYVETLHQGRPINAPRLSPRFTVSTLPDGAWLSPGETYYFAFAFEEPILGVNDFLRVAVSQTNAADEPAFANLITAAR